MTADLLQCTCSVELITYHLQVNKYYKCRYIFTKLQVFKIKNIILKVILHLQCDSIQWQLRWINVNLHNGRQQFIMFIFSSLVYEECTNKCSYFVLTAFPLAVPLVGIADVHTTCS